MQTTKQSMFATQRGSAKPQYSNGSRPGMSRKAAEQAALQLAVTQSEDALVNSANDEQINIALLDAANDAIIAASAERERLDGELDDSNLDNELMETNFTEQLEDVEVATTAALNALLALNSCESSLSTPPSECLQLRFDYDVQISRIIREQGELVSLQTSMGIAMMAMNDLIQQVRDAEVVWEQAVQAASEAIPRQLPDRRGDT